MFTTESITASNKQRMLNKVLLDSCSRFNVLNFPRSQKWNKSSCRNFGTHVAVSLFWDTNMVVMWKHSIRDPYEIRTAIGLVSKRTTLHVHHAFLNISLPSLHNYNVKWTNFKFFWGRERQGDKFYHLCLNSGAAPYLQFQPKFLSFK